MSEFPKICLAELCDKITDGTHHSPSNSQTGEFKYITAKNIKPWGLDLSHLTYVDEVTHREIYARCDVRKGDILYIKDGATTGIAAINPLDEEFSLLSSVGVLRPGAALTSKYLLYALQEPATKAKMMDGLAGVAITRLTLKKLGAAEIPVAPLAEQTRIVAKLEELLSDLDAGVAELKAAQKKLVQYRQSLLKAAVEGALTAEWRTQHQPLETGAQLLQRILQERRTRWEARQLAKFAEQGKTPPKDWQKKYPEPVQPDTTGLPELPQGWTWASVDQLCESVRNGISKTPNKDEVGFPIFRINAVRPMAVNFSAIKHIEISEGEAADYWVESGDVLATRYNGSVDLLGVFAMVKDVPARTLHPDKIFRMKAVTGAGLGGWMEISGNVGVSRSHLVSRVKTTAGQTGISGDDLKKTPIPLPPAAFLLARYRSASI